jgi:hypothetical protein
MTKEIGSGYRAGWLSKIGRLSVILLIPLFLSSCGTKQVDVKPEVEKQKQERALFQMMMHKPVNDKINFEDDWFTYELELERVVKGKFYMPGNTLGGECRYQGATYTVMDKETDTVVRTMSVDSQPCNRCHKR